jgi:hypothetical protein
MQTNALYLPLLLGFFSCNYHCLLLILFFCINDSGLKITVKVLSLTFQVGLVGEQKYNTL